jgi:hypothetical protein
MVIEDGDKESKEPIMMKISLEEEQEEKIAELSNNKPSFLQSKRRHSTGIFTNAERNQD